MSSIKITKWKDGAMNLRHIATTWFFYKDIEGKELIKEPVKSITYLDMYPLILIYLQVVVYISSIIDIFVH